MQTLQQRALFTLDPSLFGYPVTVGCHSSVHSWLIWQTTLIPPAYYPHKEPEPPCVLLYQWATRVTLKEIETEGLIISVWRQPQSIKECICMAVEEVVSIMTIKLVCHILLRSYNKSWEKYQHLPRTHTVPSASVTRCGAHSQAPSVAWLTATHNKLYLL